MHLDHKTTLQAIPDGPEGILQTLKIMRSYVRQFKIDIRIRELAQSITKNLPDKDWGGEINAIHAYIKNHIRYVRDITGVETIATPTVTLDTGSGDCDDQAVLISSLLESIGHPTRFIAIGTIPNVYQHVYAETKLGNRWVSVETTEGVNVGWQPRNVKARMLVFN